jgi:menaquinone-dependent protoporphyrinogen oxidase
VADKKITILFESIEGHTATIAQRLGQVLSANGHSVTLRRCRDAKPEDLQADVLVVGSSIHAGKQNAQAVRFAKAHRDALRGKPAAHFLVCLTARSPKPEHQAVVAGYQKDFTALTGWEPAVRRVFAGALLYTKYNFIKRKIMVSILRKEGGETDTSRDHVYTDWAAVEAFANEIGRLAGA